MVPWRRSGVRCWLFLLLLLFPAGAPHAVDPIELEVKNLRFTSQTDFEWDPPPIDPDFYNVYRTLVSTLPANYGNCLLSALPTPNAVDAALPPVGEAYIYFPTAEKATLEGSMGTDSSGGVRSNLNRCNPANVPPPPINGLINPNGPQPDGVFQGVEAPRNPAIANDLTGLAGGGVYLHTGEFFYEKVDLEIPGRGMNWRHVRRYRSQIDHDGPQGRNWTFNYDRRVIVSGPNLLYLDGTGRQDEYAPAGGGLFEPLDRGLYSKVRVVPGGYVFRERNGTRYFHFAVTGSPTDGALEAIEDRFGNRMSFLYHASGILCNVVDTLGRTIHYFWDAFGRLSSVVDYQGREVRYSYDAFGHLAEARSPVVVGTPTGNDFPVGKTTLYTYDSINPPPQLSNLLTITAPGDVSPVLQNSYNGNDELVVQDYGGINASGVPAGGQYLYGILPLGGGFREINISDRNSNLHVVRTNPSGQIIEEVDPGLRTTTHNYNNDGERTATTLPQGNQIRYVYDELNSDRFQRGNLLEVRRVADLVRGDGFGGPLPDIAVTYEYDPMYSLQRTITDPSGRDSTYTYDHQEGDPAVNGVNNLLTDWQINLGTLPLFLGDVNGDGITAQSSGNPVRLRQPDVSVLTGGRQAAIGGPLQAIDTFWVYNQFGQMIREVEPEKNVKVYEYHPEIDPDGDGIPTPPPLDGRTLDPATGGYLDAVRLDADPAPFIPPTDVASRNNAFNPIPTEIISLYLYSSAGNLIESTNGIGVVTRYDLNELGQIVQVTRDADGFAHLSRQIYNERDEIVQRRVQDSTLIDGFMDVFTVYDILGNAVELRQDLSNTGVGVTEYRYDANENRTSVTHPEGNVFTMEYDERDLLFRLIRDDNDLDASNGGPTGSSEQFFEYDDNGNPTQFTDGNSTIWPFTYDGMDRRIQAHIVPGAVAYTTLYNPDETISFRLIHDATTTYHQTFFGYDELGRTRNISQLLLDSAGNPLNESASGNAFAVVFNEYDRNSRRSRVIGDGGRISDFDYDGAGRLITKTDALGNIVRYQYDDNNNVIQTREEESTDFGTETFVTTYVYDSLDRLIRTTDPATNQRSLTYDDRDNLVTSEDRLGNTISYAYDATGRRTSIVRDLRTGGTGAGSVFDQITYRFEYDANGRTVRMVDPEGNSTQYSYDGLNRKIVDQFDDGTQIVYSYDPNDNVIRVEDANGSITAITYDSQDRPIARIVNPAPGIPPTSQTFGYDNFNRLVESTDQTGASPFTAVSRDYDSYNRLRSEETQLGGNPPRRLEYTYDGDGNRTSASYPTGGVPNVVTYAYDSLGRLISTGDSQTGFSSGYSYLGPERVAERFHGNGTRLSYLDPFATGVIGYDGIKRVVQLRHYDGTATQTGFDYTYDEESNPTSEVRLHDAGQGDVWVYDSAYRLIDYKRDVVNPTAEVLVPGTGGAIQRRTQYSLDRVGNWIERTINDVVSGTFGTFGNTPNNLNEYGEKPDDGIPDDFGDDLGTPPPDGENLGHDPGGDLVTEGPRTYTYDALHRLVAVEIGGGPLASYTYDALNRRVAKQVFPTGPGTGTRYVYDGDRAIAEFQLDPLNNELFLQRRYFRGNEGHPVAMYDELGAQLFYFHEDARGNVRAATDAAGNVVERITYGAYGTPEFRDPFNLPTGLTESLIGNPYLYLGQRWDPETQLYEKRAAMFAPRYGRHLQRLVPGQHIGPLGLALNPPDLFPNLLNWIGMNPWWWCKGWFWNPGAWWGGWWGWRAGWWWGGPWGWWGWRPWVWFGVTHYGWWRLSPWSFWWGGPYAWWGWQAWWPWSGWWGWWPWWGWGGWCGWWPWFGWSGWYDWWPWWGWGGWVGWWPNFGWWGWCGWWPYWNVWWGWTPYFWWGWWTWSPWWWDSYWSWSGIGWLWNWWAWVNWWPWGWWNWAGWWDWWGWVGWNPWWWWGWWDWSILSWARINWWWWGPIGWWPWWGWGWWLPWSWWGWWSWIGWWGWWLWPWWGGFFWGWWNWWGWWIGWWHWPWWGWWRWWGAWWPWWGWWC